MYIFTYSRYNSRRIYARQVHCNVHIHTCAFKLTQDLRKASRRRRIDTMHLVRLEGGRPFHDPHCPPQNSPPLPLPHVPRNHCIRCICVCLYVCVWVCMYVITVYGAYVCVCMCVCVCVYVCMYVITVYGAYECVCVYVCVYVYVCILCISTCMHAWYQHMRVHSLYHEEMCTSNIHIHIHTHMHKSTLATCTLTTCIPIYIHTCVYMHSTFVHMYAQVFMYTQYARKDLPTTSSPYIHTYMRTYAPHF